MSFCSHKTQKFHFFNRRLRCLYCPRVVRLVSNSTGMIVTPKSGVLAKSWMGTPDNINGTTSGFWIDEHSSWYIKVINNINAYVLYIWFPTAVLWQCTGWIFKTCVFCGLSPKVWGTYITLKFRSLLVMKLFWCVRNHMVVTLTLLKFLLVAVLR